MNQETLTTILQQSEGDALDFKRDQYPFVGVLDEARAELLKDVLAFANAWKTSDAHIVIGIEEKDGRMASVAGVTGPLPDHSVQQFVSAKTNRPISFAVENVTYESLLLTIIRFSQHQRRPIFLKRDFGKLKADTVYVRRGSSTVVAKADEIAEMGRAEEAGFKIQAGSGVRPEELWNELKGLWKEGCDLMSEWLKSKDNPPVEKATEWAERTLTFCKRNLTMNEIKKIDSPFQPQSSEVINDAEAWDSHTNRVYRRLVCYEAYLQEFMREIGSVPYHGNISPFYG